MSEPLPAGLSLGRAPRPGDDAEFVRRLRGALASGVGGIRIEGLSSDAVAARLDGADIVQLDVDASGARVEQAGAPDEPMDAEAFELPETAEIERGMLRSARVSAHPVEVLGAPVTLDATVESFPIEWITRVGGALELFDSVAEQEPAMTADLRVRIDHTAISTLVREVAARATAETPQLAVTETELAVTGAGVDALAVEGAASIAMGLLRARIRLAATVRIVDGCVVRVEGLELGSRNILAAVAVAALRSRIEQAVAGDVDLATMLGVPESAEVRATLRADDGGVEARVRVR